MSDTNRQAPDLSHSLLYAGAWADSSPCNGPVVGPDGLGLELGLLSCNLKGKSRTPPLNKPSTPSPKKTSSTKKAKGSKTSTHKGTHTKPGMSTWLQEHDESPWTLYRVTAKVNTASPGPGGAVHTSNSKPAGANTPTGFQG